MYKQRTNSGDSFCSSKLADSLDISQSDHKPSTETTKIKKKKRKMKVSNLSKYLSAKKDESLKRKRIESEEKPTTSYSISPTSSSSSSAISTDTSNKMAVSASMESSPETLSDNSFNGNDTTTTTTTTNKNNENLSSQDDDPFEPTCLDMSSKENSNIFKTLFLEKPIKIEDETPINFDIEKLVEDCKRSLGIENIDLNQNVEIFSKLNEIKQEATIKNQQPGRENEIIDECKKKLEEYKKLVEEKSKNEIEIMKQDFDSLIKEMQYNSGWLSMVFSF